MASCLLPFRIVFALAAGYHRWRRRGIARNITSSWPLFFQASRQRGLGIIIFSCAGGVREEMARV